MEGVSSCGVSRGWCFVDFVVVSRWCHLGSCVSSFPYLLVRGYRFYAYPRVRLYVTLVCFVFGCLHGYCCGLCVLSGGVWFVTTGVSKVVRGRDKIVWACDC